MTGEFLLTGLFFCPFTPPFLGLNKPFLQFFRENLKKVRKIFGGFKKSPYLCTRLKEQDNTQSYNGSKKGV